MSVNPTDQSVIGAIEDRWSPYRFEPQPVEDDKILRCLEAARWAASSFNDQPWHWIVARRQDEEEMQRMVACLAEPNQAWARTAGVLMLTVIRTTFRYNGEPNRVALHDLGQAAAHLALQAADLGLQVHQMAGVNLSVVRRTYGVPDGFEPQTAIAIGYPNMSDPNDDVGKELQKRERGSRKRLSLSEQAFSGKWANTASWVD